MSCYFLEATAFAKLFVQEPGTDALIRLMEAVEDNRKLISASTPLEVYAAIRRRERAGGISAEDAAAALDILRLEAARMVQQPLNPAVLEAARQLLDRTTLALARRPATGRRARGPRYVPGHGDHLRLRLAAAAGSCQGRGLSRPRPREGSGCNDQDRSGIKEHRCLTSLEDEM